MKLYEVVDEFIIENTGALSQTLRYRDGHEVTYITDLDGIEYEETAYYSKMAWFL